MTGATIGHYRILSKLGEGGMGVVYAAEDITLGRRVALKFCASGRDDQKVRANLLKEARAASSLSHPNIAHIYEFVENPGGEPFIAMELVAGDNLRQILRERRLSIEETMQVATGVASALAEAHRHGIIHRDIKPGNIQVTPAGGVKVLDFGIAGATVLPGAHSREAATQTLEGFSGTPLYMSPEQASGEMLDARSDLFSLGAVLYECLTGKSPFAAESLTAMVARLLTWEPPRPSKLNPQTPANLDGVVLKLLAKDRRQRYASGDEVLADLAGTPALPPSRRRIMGAIAGGVVSVAGGAAVWWRMRQRHREPAAAAVPWYREGVAALHSGAYHRASKALAKAVELDPSYVMAHAYLAEAWYELDYLERAKDELLKIMGARNSLPEIEALHLDAIQETVVGDFKAAAEKFQQVANLSPPEDRDGALLDLGRAQQRNQDTRQAIATYKEAIRLDPQNADAWLRLGALQARTGARDESGRSLDRAESLFQSASSIEGVTECQYVRARFARTPAEAREWIGKALAAARVTGNEQQQIKLLLLSSNTDLDAGDTAQALDEANRAIQIAYGAGIENLVSRALIDLGNALFIKHRTADALRTIEEALDIARRNREKRSEARALVTLGSIRIQSGDAAEGWQNVQDAMAYYKQGSFRNEAAIALILLGRASRDKGDYGGARRAFAETLATMQPAGPSVPLALAEEGIASLDLRQDRWPEALRMFDQARATFAASGNSTGAAIDEVNVALMHALLGHKGTPAPSTQSLNANPDTAAELALVQGHFAEARAQAEALLSKADPSDRELRRAANLALGLALARSGAGARGLEACRRAIDLAHASGNPMREAEARLAAAEAALAANDRPDAAQYAAAARAYFESAKKPEALWRSCVLLLLSGEGGAPVAAQAANALGELKASWPGDEFRSYLDRQEIKRMYAILLHAAPGASAPR